MMIAPRPCLALGLAAALALLAGPGLKAESPYEPVPDFLELPEDFEFGQTVGVAVDSEGRLIVSHRGPRPILVFEPDGTLIRTFGDEQLSAVHGTRVDRDDNIWVTDMRNHTVIKFSPEGEVLLLLGRRDEPGDDEERFNRPTDIAFAPNGDFFVSDGYGNTRVLKFSADGTFLKSWGVSGSFTGQFNLPHGVVVDAEGLLHVADRENDRIQVFDLDGNFVRLYGGFAPFGMFLAPDQTLYIADGRAHEAIRMTLEGKPIARWGAEGTGPGEFDLPHGIAVDRDGNVYVTEITGKRIQKFAPRPDAELLSADDF